MPTYLHLRLATVSSLLCSRRLSLLPAPSLSQRCCCSSSLPSILNVSLPLDPSISERALISPFLKKLSRFHYFFQIPFFPSFYKKTQERYYFCAQFLLLNPLSLLLGKATSDFPLLKPMTNSVLALPRLARVWHGWRLPLFWTLWLPHSILLAFPLPPWLLPWSPLLVPSFSNLCSAPGLTLPSSLFSLISLSLMLYAESYLHAEHSRIQSGLLS